MKSAQWREKRDGPSEGVGGHTGTGQAENKMGGFHIFGHTTERSFFFSHKTWVAKCHDSADRERERKTESEKDFAERWPRLIVL